MAPPIHILKRFLEANGLKDGPRFLRMYQGGEMWQSKMIYGITAKSGYDIDITGSDAINENGKVEPTNGTCCWESNPGPREGGTRACEKYCRSCNLQPLIREECFHIPKWILWARKNTKKQIPASPHF
jgi:hypothetical protein